jgi:transcriptional regulator with XRE-family HTH domain
MSELARQPDVRLALDNDALFQVAENLIYLRKHRGLTQQALAKKMGTSQAKVARIEGGRENVTLRTLERAVVALGGRLALSIAPAELHFPRLPSWWSMPDAVGAVSPYSLHFIHAVESGSGSLKVGAGWSGPIRALPTATLLTESNAV